MAEFITSRFRSNPFEKHIIKIGKLMETLQNLETVGGTPMTDLSEEDKKNALVALKYLETARSVLYQSDKQRVKQ